MGTAPHLIRRPSLQQVTVYAIFIGSLWIGLTGPEWGIVALAATLIDVIVLKPFVLPWASRVARIPAGVRLVLLLVVWPIVPTIWVWCAVRILSGSWILATVVAAVVGPALTVHLVSGAERWRRTRARGEAVRRKKRAAAVLHAAHRR
jgi:hypothetical protein